MLAILHGHFYQPPRENPWTDSVPRQASARPYHDWNERITDECYRANAWSRVLGNSGKIAAIVNNYRHLSFDFGPTLLRDLLRREPDTYRSILEADRASVEERAGHGNAIAQAYNHMILPLSSARDKVTQVRWGLRDFAVRFGRKSEGLWLPETAIDAETLAVLAAEGVKYIILAPTQARRIRRVGDGPWQDVLGRAFDTGRAYRAFVDLPSSSPSPRAASPAPRGARAKADAKGEAAREAAKRPYVDVFFYDGDLAGAVSFQHLLRRAEDLADRIEGAGRSRALVHFATDGEVYGHHERFADMCLAYFAEHEAPRRGIRLENYGQHLDAHPPEHEVELNYAGGEGTAWSCAHGVGRWVRDCGCNTSSEPGWNQAWRGPLRAGLDVVRDAIQEALLTSTTDCLRDPWAARDAYVDVLLDPSPGGREGFLAVHAPRTLNAEERARVWSMLEASHQAMLMYTSCGWFFSDISGIEPRQNLAYAARAIELASPYLSVPIEPRLIEHLREARSNVPRWGDGEKIYRAVLRRRLSPEVTAARAAFEMVFFGRPLERRIHNFRVTGRIERPLLDTLRSKAVHASSSWSGELSLADDSLERTWEWKVDIRAGKDGGREITLDAAGDGVAKGDRTVIPIRGMLRRLPADLRRETGRELQETLLRETRGWIEQLHDLPKRLLPELSAEVSPFFRALEQTVRRWELTELTAQLLREGAIPSDWWEKLKVVLKPGQRQRLRLPLERLGIGLASRIERCLAHAAGAKKAQALILINEACDLLDRADRVGLNVPRRRLEERAYELLMQSRTLEAGGAMAAAREGFDPSLLDGPAVRRLASHANLELDAIHTPATRTA